MSPTARTRGGALLRFGLAALLVIACAAAITAVGGLLQFRQLAQDITPNGNHGIKISGIQIPKPGQPQTILLIGSDHRAADPTYKDARTDTIMLMRIDASSSTINVLSIPRDLKVQIPDGGLTQTAKINAAYSAGGPNLLLKILKTQVFAGQDFHVNHVVDVNFGGFSDLVDAIGCVYGQVDHRYYNQSALGIDNYSSIDIEPGYQRLCGDNQAPTGALAFVRSRHSDSDIVRNARQQDFIRWARENYSGGQLFANRDKLLKIFGKHATTDNTLHSAIAIETLVVLLATSAGHQLHSVPFPAQTPPCDPACYVTADGPAENRAYQQLITPTQKAAQTTTPTATPTATKPPPATSGHHRKKKPASVAPPGLAADPQDGTTQSDDLGNSGLPVYYPKFILGPTAASSEGAVYCSSVIGNCDDPTEPASEYVGAYPRQYRILGTDGHRYRSYAMTLQINASLGDYFTVEGTTWKHPPILKSPTQVEVVDGRKLFEYFNGTGSLSLVAWHTPTAVYWISNTLENYIKPAQMKAMAASFTLGYKAPPPGSTAQRSTQDITVTP